MNRTESGLFTRARESTRRVTESDSNTRDGKDQRAIADSEDNNDNAESDRSSSSACSSLEAAVDSSSGPAPLSRVVGSFIAPPPSKEHMDWHTLRSLLYLLRFGSVASPHRDPTVLAALDQTQKAVLALLEEWWTGQAHDKILPKMKQYTFFHALESAADESTFDFHLETLESLACEGDLPFLHEAARIYRLSLSSGEDDPSRYMEYVERIPQDMRESAEDQYHGNMGTLYSCELDPLEQTSYQKSFREVAADVSARERIARHALTHVNSGRMENPSSGAMLEKSRLKDFSQPIPTILDPCHWLASNEAVGFPWYLWDIELGCTVRTTEIPSENIRYSIVSHTWGRLRDGEAMESVCGVPWRVPKITRYDVKLLPQMIKDAGFSEPYIWMDLLCIPQEMSVDWQLAICKAELPRQLAIFRNASTAVVWLNDVASWKSTEGAIVWMGLRYLGDDPTGPARYTGLYDLDTGCDIAAPNASSPCGLVKADIIEDAEDTEQEQVPSAWFTSLWTLQEILIRPDMVLLDKNWQPLAIGNTLLITLDSLVSLAGELSATEDAPIGAESLLSMFHDRHLSLLRIESRLVPLVLGANRVSTCPRAPAIMSAMGATNWFRGRTLQQFQSPEEADLLVLGCYPLDFVNEVLDLSGAAFFSCTTTTATLVMDDDTGTKPAPGYPLQGTMLPFMPIPANLYQGVLEPGDAQVDDIDHSSVSSWRIHLDGSVTLPTVAIIASNSIELQSSCQLKCLIQCNDPENITSLHTVWGVLPLYDWIRRFGGDAHAICTRLSEEHIVGIIIHRWANSNSYVKAGGFSYGWPDTFGGPDEENKIVPELLTVLDVNWHVL
ncbi:hypothetical protein ASPSYDRAFT_34368 [Aspergillus sydowii CBS 593.65]|uniref:Heterokaryon incompatibility domain-containing protein n=1 Tax=Aspergillus sydowii CBS 593.65 TaxID=1036612 RepID=A0A1L9T7T7_9EURO|nr:uncharacterized protein ASPSYDRAFT_34368 [Aspergillus sydowii CBS 593.65]OJJ55441.1 hypothetical protein ASPSYDRAFT_34368 [Aspergillus sydowii CBS 593.65]